MSLDVRFPNRHFQVIQDDWDRLEGPVAYVRESKSLRMPF